MDGSPAPGPTGHSRAPGWTLSGVGATGLAAASAVLLFLYLTGRFIWVYNKEAAASAASPGPASPPVARAIPIPRPRRAVLLSLLPVFVHMGAAAASAPECAVCLSEFGEREAGRLLPGCGHRFQEECITTWLQLNTTCPLCRAAVAVATKY